MSRYSRFGGYGYRFDIGSYFPPAIKTICIVCVAVFFLEEISRLLFGLAGWNFWISWFGLRPYEVTHAAFVWQLASYIFLHAGILHIAFNLLYLAMFGAAIEHMWGARRFTTYFFVCGIGAGLVNVIVKTLMDPHGRGPSLDPTIGASGAIYGVLLAAAILMPHSKVWVFPLPVTISMRWFVIAMGALEFFMTIGATGDSVSHVTHLGGILAGYLYLRRGSFLYNVRNSYSDWHKRRLRRKFDVYAQRHQDRPPSRPDRWVN